MLRNMHASIVDYDLSMLRSIARARGVELKAARQAIAVDELKSHMLSGESIDWAWSRLPGDARGALEDLLRAGGQMKAHIFTHRFGKPRSFGPGRLEREKPWLAPQNPTEYLWFLGLIFSTFHDVGGGHRAEFIYVPSDVVPFLPEVEVVLPRFEVSSMDEPATIRCEGTASVDSVFRLLCRLQMDPLPIDGKGLLTEAARRHLGGAYGSAPGRTGEVTGEPPLLESKEYFEFTLHLSRAAGLVHASKRKLRPHPKLAREWLKWSLRQQLYCLQQTWLVDPTWDELRRIPDLVIEETGWKNDPVLARGAVMGHLRDCSTAACPPGVWLSVLSLVAAVKTVDPDFARPDGDYRSWYIRDRAGGEYLMDFACWDDVEARLLVHLLGEPLYRLGVVDLGYEGDSLSAFRISTTGETLLDKTPPPFATEAPPAKLEVHSDFTLHFGPGARLYERFQTHRFARLERDTEVEAVYQITQGSLAAGRAQGISPRMIIAFLQQHSLHPLPSEVVNALHRFELSP